MVTEKDLRAHFPPRLNVWGRPVKKRRFGGPNTLDPDARCVCGELVELITGYMARDVLFRPLIREYFTTQSYVGVQHKFGDRVKASIIGEYLRSWRVQDNLYAIAQAIRPGFNVEVTPNMHWTVNASGVWSRGEGYHFYDNVSNQVLVTYVRSVQRSLNNGVGEVSVRYPLRFSFGIQQQTFYDFAGRNSTTVRPVVRLSLF